jgi:programmed cell death 8 (apoptosis-inducing factor)
VLPNTSIVEAEVLTNGKLLIHLSDGSQMEVDHAVVAVGIDPNTELAKTSQLEVDDSQDGFRVNAELEAR